MDNITEPAERPHGPPDASPYRHGSLLVGRRHELAFLREELSEAIQGRGRLVLLGGEAGIGKTSLARDLAREAVHGGVRAISGHCYDLTNTPPYGPWLELFRPKRDDQNWPTPPAAFREGQAVRVSDQASLFSEVRHFIAEFAARSPLYLLLEDLHWSDPASIDLLRHIAPYLRDLPVLLVATYRVDELTRQHPLFQHLPSLIREGDAARLEPRPLDADALFELVRSRYRLHAGDETRLVSYLEQHAEGNPFFAVELLRALEEKGLVRAGNGRSTLGELQRVVVPALLRQVIDGRVSRLGEETRLPLEIASVIGQDVPLALWSDITDVNEEILLTIAERLSGAHLIEMNRNGTHIHFVHALTRETIYDGISPPRRRLLHRRVGEALAAEQRADPDAVAVHFHQAGDPLAWQWFVRAADRAQRVYAWVTAAARLREAASLLDGVEGEERTYSMLVFRLSHLLRFSDTTASIEAINEVERLARRLGDPILEAEAQSIRGIHLCYADEFRTGLTEMQKSLAVLESVPLDTARVTAALRLWFSVASAPLSDTESTDDDLLVTRLNAVGVDFRRCTYLWFNAVAGRLHSEASASFIDLFEGGSGVRGGVRIAVAFANHCLGIASAAMGQPEKAQHFWSESRSLFDVVEHFALITFCQLGELRDVALTYGAGNPSYRRRLADEAETSLSRAGGAFRPGITPRLAWLGCLYLDGRWDEIGHILRDLPETGNSFLRREATATRAVLARNRGQPDLAWVEIARLIPEGPFTEPGDNIHQEGLLLQRLAAELCFDSGDRLTARAWLEANDRWLGWSGSVLGVAEGKLGWARLHLANDDLTAARAFAGEALLLATDPDQPLVQLAAHRHLGCIAGRIGQYTEAKEQFERALDLSTRCDVPFERGLTLLAMADLNAEANDAAAASPLLQEAFTLFDRLGALPSLARAEHVRKKLEERGLVDLHPAGLTRREMDVLRLIGRNRTDKEIAEALFISPHTASTHVKHVLTKLGATNRREAAGIAIRLQLDQPHT